MVDIVTNKAYVFEGAKGDKVGRACLCCAFAMLFALHPHTVNPLFLAAQGFVDSFTVLASKAPRAIGCAVPCSLCTIAQCRAAQRCGWAAVADAAEMKQRHIYLLV